MKKYKIRGIGEPFDGLIVHTADIDYGQDIVPILRIEQPSSLFKSFSVPVDGLLVSREKLEEWTEQEDDFLTDNPYGEFVSSGMVEGANFSVYWALYDNAVTVKVMNKGRSLYTQSFYGDDIQRVRELLRKVQDDPEYSVDIVFDLAAIEEEDAE